MIDAKYLGLTANKLAKIASELDIEKEALCARIDELCEENEKLREIQFELENLKDAQLRNVGEKVCAQH